MNFLLSVDTQLINVLIPLSLQLMAPAFLQSPCGRGQHEASLWVCYHNVSSKTSPDTRLVCTQTMLSAVQWVRCRQTPVLSPPHSLTLHRHQGRCPAPASSPSFRNHVLSSSRMVRPPGFRLRHRVLVPAPRCGSNC